MTPRFFASCTLLAISVFCAACKNSPPPPQAQSAAAASGSQSQSPTASPVTGVLVSAQPGSAVKGQAATPGSQLTQNAAQPSVNPPAPAVPFLSLSDAEERLGPFTLAPGQDFIVIVHSKRLEQQPGKFDSAASWVEIRDVAGGVHFRQEFGYTVENGTFNEQCSVNVQVLAGANGKGILMDSGCLPSAPLSGGAYRFFGLVNGKLTPFAKDLYLEGNMERFVPGPITKQGAATMFGPDMLEFKVFTGNFFVLLPLRINWMQARLEPGMRCYEQSGHGMVESGCEVPIFEVQRMPGEEEMTFVRMFPEANDGFLAAHAVVKKDSKVEILAARVREVIEESKDSMNLGVADDIWLKVRVDGKVGWIHGQEDFLAIGLPQSG